MRVAKLLTIAALFAFFSNSAFAETELKVLKLPQSPYLIGQPNPALADVNRLYIAINLQFPGAEDKWEFTRQIEQRVKDTFRDSEINVIDTTVDENSPLAPRLKKQGNSLDKLRFRPANIPEFRIDVDLLNLADANQCVFRLQTSFSKKAILENGPKAIVMADVWKDDPVLRLVASKDVNESIIAVAIRQTKTFIGSWSAARTSDKQSETQSRNATDEKNTNTIKKQSVESKYVGSKTSEVFHKADCQFAQKIKPENLVSYDSREDAVGAGKRPCSRCKP